MLNFISTDTVILLNLLRSSMPNLNKYLTEYSTTKSAKNMTAKPTQVLSTPQIQEACRHPNTIIAYALAAIIKTQNALNAANAKIKELLKERNLVENTLVNLLSINDEETPQESTDKIPPSSTETLQKYLIEINKEIQDLSSTKDKLANIPTDIDNTISQLGIKDSIRCTQDYADIVKELKDVVKLDLTDDKKNMFRYVGSTYSSLIAADQNLSKHLHVKLPQNASDVVIISATVISEALSSTLQKPEETYNIIRKLKSIDEADNNAKKFRSLAKEEFKKFEEATSELLKETNIPGLSPEQRDVIDNINDIIAKIVRQRELAAQHSNEQPEYANN